MSKTSSDIKGVNSTSAILDIPGNLVTATPDEAKQVLPFCYAFALQRRRSFESRKLIIRYCPPADVVVDDTASKKRPRESYVEMIYPFSSNSALRDQYRLFRYDKPRLGLILEDLDTFAGDVALRHCGLPGRMLLTAAIDKISWLQAASAESGSHDREIALTHDLRVAGQVNWVGHSSMGVLIELSVRAEDGPSGPGDWHVVGFARFVMVSRHLRRVGSLPVPELLVTTDREKFLFEDGQEHARLGRVRRGAHLRPREPSADELAELIRVMRATKRRTYAAAMRVGSGGGAIEEGAVDDASTSSFGVAVPMQRTVLHTAALMQHQDRNSYDVIFGGHLLRLAYEHAAAAAALHAGRLCAGLSMDDVTFRAPVPIGCLLQLKAQVVFVEGPVLRVHVTASKTAPELSPGQSVVTNTFSFAFANRRLADGDAGPEFLAAPPVYPETLSEAMEYVAGLQRHMHDESSAQAVGKWAQQVAAERSSGGGRRDDGEAARREQEVKAVEAAALMKMSRPAAEGNEKDSKL